MHHEGRDEKMSVTHREKIMLSLLLVIAVLAGSYYLVISPSLEKYNNLQDEKAVAQAAVDELNITLAGYAAVEKNVAELGDEIQNLTTKFYPSIIQQKLFLKVDEFISTSGVRVNGISLAGQNGIAINTQYQEQTTTSGVNPAPQAAEGESAEGTSTEINTSGKLVDLAQQYYIITGTNNGEPVTDSNGMDASVISASLAGVEVLSASLDFTGTYDQIRTFVKLMEAENRYIQIKSVNYSGIVTQENQNTDNTQTDANEAQDNTEDADTAEESATDTNTSEETTTPITNNATIQSGLIQGAITLDFYAVPKIFEQDEDYKVWP